MRLSKKSPSRRPSFINYGRVSSSPSSGNVADLVSTAARRPIPLNKSIVGEHVFTHESGIHVDGLLKDRRAYQSFDPGACSAARTQS